MKSNKLFFIVLIVFLFLIACETKLVKGKVDSIEYESYNEESSSEYVYHIRKPSGFVIIECVDGKKIRCKNPYPDISKGNEVSIKETSSGDWVIAEYNITSN